MARKKEPAHEPPRLVQQPDGYADYAEDVRGPRPDSPAGSARPRRRRRQRPIRSTITVLLIIPLLAMVGLWAYSFTTTIGGYLATRSNDQANADVGGPLQNMIAQLDQESALTYLLYDMPPVPGKPEPIPAQQKRQQLKAAQAQVAGLRKQLIAQRPRTDAAIEAFRAGQSKLDSDGDLPAQARPLTDALTQRLRDIPVLRAQADGHQADALTVFQGYNAVISSVFPYVEAMANPQSPIGTFSRFMGAIYLTQALTDVAIEETLGQGAQQNGGALTAPAYRLFARTVAAQRQLESSGATLLSFRNSSGDPSLEAIRSPRFKDFQALEDQIIDAGPDSRLPAAVISGKWQRRAQAVVSLLTARETGERAMVASDARQHADVTEYQTFGVGGAGLLLVLAASLLLLRFGRRISRELHALSETAQWLPGAVSRMRVGADLEAEVEEPPSLRLKTRILEVTQTAEAFSAVQRTAMDAAAKEAVLRKAVNNVFRSLARRNQSLLQRQLKMLDEMERRTEDPDALGQLFRLDHLTTRMRRQAEGLIILSGATPGRGWRQPVQVVEVLRGAIGEIEDYARVDLSTDSHDYLQGAGVADVIHLLAELIENAVAYSPPGTRVQVRGVRVARGYAVEVEDRGLGIHDQIREALNQRLSDPPGFDVADSDQLGLFVVSRLAARHGITVSLRKSSYGGTAAIVLLPQSLVVTADEAAFLAAREYAVPRPASLPPASAPALANAPSSGPVNGPATGPANDFDRTGPHPTGPIPRPAPADSYPIGPGGLPRRQKPVSDSPRPSAEPAAAPVARSSPEQARALLSSIQRGLRTGRAAELGQSDPPPTWEGQ